MKLNKLVLIVSLIVSAGYIGQTFANVPSNSKKKHKSASHKATSKNRKITSFSKADIKYDYSTVNKSPFTYKDMGMSDAEFFITDKQNDNIHEEIEKVQSSLSELEYTNQVSYEPKYLNQHPQTQIQKRAYLEGYLKILEEATTG